MTISIRVLRDRVDGLKGAFVLRPVPPLAALPRVLVAREGGFLGPHGWGGAARGLLPRDVERHGEELWLLFGPEVAHYVRPGEPVQIEILGTALRATAIWPAMARGTAPEVIPDDEAAERALWQQMQERLAGRAPAAPPPPADETIIARPAPAPAPPPVSPPPPPRPRPPAPHEPQPPTRWPLALLALVLLAAAGAAAWWFWPQPAPPAPPVADPCLSVPRVLAGDCPRERLAELPPETQAHLGLGLVAHGGAAATDLAVRLLNVAAARGEARAQLGLGRLYDPARPNALVPPDPERAVDLYRAAAENDAEARAALATLLAWLRRQAEGEGAEAARAQDILRRIGER